MKPLYICKHFPYVLVNEKSGFKIEYLVRPVNLEKKKKVTKQLSLTTQRTIDSLSMFHISIFLESLQQNSLLCNKIKDIFIKNTHFPCCTIFLVNNHPR